MPNSAAEMAPKIRFNVLAPSLVDTPLAEKFLNNDTKKSNAEARHPLQRIGSPEEIARMVAFLLGDQSSWMTAQSTVRGRCVEKCSVRASGEDVLPATSYAQHAWERCVLRMSRCITPKSHSNPCHPFQHGAHTCVRKGKTNIGRTPHVTDLVS